MNVLMCCSDLSYKGGMVSVLKGYLGYSGWHDIDITFVPTHRDAGKAELITYFAKAYSRILSLAVRKKIDIAHLHTAERGSFIRKAIIALTLKRFGIPVVMHHHGAEFEEYYASASPRLKRFIKKVLTEVDTNIVLSNRLTDMIRSKAPDARVDVVYNAVSLPPVNPYNPDGKSITLLGRLGKRKGAYDLLKAISMIDTQIEPDVRFNLCGDGETDEVRIEAERLGIAHRIGHIGWIDGDDKRALIADTIINVLPSYNEGLPMTILETMAQGIPSVTTRIASIPEVVDDGINGYMIEPGDIVALADTLKSLANNRELRITLSRNAFLTISERFSLPKSIDRLEKIYHSLTAR